MALSKDVLGLALYEAANSFNDQEPPEDPEANRLEFWKTVADTIINHFKTTGVINVTVATTGTAAAQTGTGIGTIS